MYGSAIPEHLAIRAVENITPERTFGAGVGTILAIDIREFAHGQVLQLSLLFEFAVVCHAVFITLEQEFVIGFPPPALAHPAGTDEHHVVGIAAIVFRHWAVLVDDILEIGQFMIFIDHAAQNVLRMCTVVGTRSIEDSHQVTRKMRDGNDANIVIFVRGDAVDVPLGWDPGVPGSAIQ